jgi:cysteine desulfurase / selenocysteine lyase
MTTLLEKETRPDAASIGLDVNRVRADFPILRELVHGKPLVYLDNANTTQKPQIVIDTLRDYYETANANVHRANHVLGVRADRAFEEARRKVQRFINAAQFEEIVYVRNATEGINLVAQTWGRKNISAGDEIILSAMEHHANIVPWQLLAEEKGATLKVIPITPQGELRMDEFERLLTPRTKIVGIVHMSNALGTVNPVEDIIRIAHRNGIPVLVDAAQSAYHLPLDVQAMDCDFLVFSGHKLYGPTGIGVLYGKKALLDAMPPFMGGGDMILSVTFEKTVFNDPPFRFEAGTPNIAGAIGLGAAIDYLSALGMDNLARHEAELMAYGTEALTSIDGLRMIGTARHKASVFSFNVGDIHSQDLGFVLDREGIAIRTGQHCAHPALKCLNETATARASLGCYNTKDELDTLVRAIHKAVRLMS